jgi:hypothetical protein
MEDVVVHGVVPPFFHHVFLFPPSILALPAVPHTLADPVCPDAKPDVH